MQTGWQIDRDKRLAEKDLKILMDKKVDIGQQWMAQKTSLGLILQLIQVFYNPELAQKELIWHT